MNATEQRTRWLEAVKQIVLLAAERRSRFLDLCPEYRHDDDVRHDALKRIAEINQSIEQSLHAMAELESDSLGARAILGSDATDLERLAVVLLIAERLSHDASNRHIGNLLDLLGGRDVLVQLNARCLFRSDSRLRIHIHVLPAETLDAGKVVLTEAALNKVLGLKPDASEAICHHFGSTGRWAR